MTTKDAALKLALEALESVTKHFTRAQSTLRDSEVRGEAHKAIIAIREALAQPQQEPFEYWNAVEGWVKIDEVRQHFDSVGCGTIYKTAGEDRVPLYTSPPARKPLPGSAALEQALTRLQKRFADLEGKVGKPLTNQKIDEIAGGHVDYFDRRVFARAIEAAHGIKE